MITAIFIFTGCRAYRGYCTYNNNVRLPAENEVVLSESYDLNFQGSVEVKYKRKIKYDEVIREEKIEEKIYSEVTGSGVAAKITLSPLILALSPLYILSTGAETTTVNEKVYYCSYWRMLHNKLCPFIYDLAEDKKIEKEVIESSVVRRKQEKTQTAVIQTPFAIKTSHGIVKIQTGQSMLDAGKTVFVNLLPEKEEEIVWNSGKQRLRVKSTEFLEPEALKKWRVLQNIQRPEEIYGNYMINLAKMQTTVALEAFYQAVGYEAVNIVWEKENGK